MIRRAARLPALVSLALTVALSLALTALQVTLPMVKDSTRFAVLGDTGTGDKPQYEIGRRLEEYRQRANFTFTIMVGDNIYGSERPQDFRRNSRSRTSRCSTPASPSMPRSATTTITTSASTSR